MERQAEIFDKLTVKLVQSDYSSVIAREACSRTDEGRFDAFFIVKLDEILERHELWSALLPRVEPFYAVKCNDDPAVLSTLVRLGTGFDCASKVEIEKILALKVPPNRIVFANPCKQFPHLEYAAEQNVDLTTFDNECELHKVKRCHPNAKLILRILPPVKSDGPYWLGEKFGCHCDSVVQLLRLAKKLELYVIGVSFHVGNECSNSTAFTASIALARTIFDLAEAEGFNFHLLDIGGGFPGDTSSFEKLCPAINQALDLHFPESTDVRIIAEPGRYYVASAFTLVTNVIGFRAVRAPNVANGCCTENGPTDETQYMYYINEGRYGSMYCALIFEKYTPTLLSPQRSATELTYKSSVWGPTCCSTDCIIKECLLPKLDCGDWLLFHNLGAYTVCLTSDFNGMENAKCNYYMQGENWFNLNRDLKSSTATICNALPDHDGTIIATIGNALPDGTIIEKSVDPFHDCSAEMKFPWNDS